MKCIVSLNNTIIRINKDHDQQSWYLKKFWEQNEKNTSIHETKNEMYVSIWFLCDINTHQRMHKRKILILMIHNFTDNTVCQVKYAIRNSFTNFL